jgi:DNA-directed RNA polymerase subunit RPC12/RpoP
MKISLSLVKEKRGKKTFTCPNPACGKTFRTPLKTLNLQQDSAQTYTACPFCLTKITEVQIENSNKPEKAQVETILSKEKQNGSKEKPFTCQYHLGYLSEREKNQQIPDKCITCQDIVDCMLRKMRT